MRIKKYIDLLIVSLIHLVLVLYLIASIIGNNCGIVNLPEVGAGYLIFWFPLFSFVAISLCAVFFLLWSIRIRSCIYTKIATWLFCIIMAWTLFSFFNIVSYSWYINILYGLFIAEISAQITTYLIKRYV